MSEENKDLLRARNDGYRAGLRDAADALEAGLARLGGVWLLLGAGDFLAAVAADLRKQAAEMHP